MITLIDVVQKKTYIRRARDKLAIHREADVKERTECQNSAAQIQVSVYWMRTLNPREMRQ